MLGLFLGKKQLGIVTPHSFLLFIKTKLQHPPPPNSQTAVFTFLLMYWSNIWDSAWRVMQNSSLLQFCTFRKKTKPISQNNPLIFYEEQLIKARKKLICSWKIWSFNDCWLFEMDWSGPTCLELHTVKKSGPIEHLFLLKWYLSHNDSNRHFCNVRWGCKTFKPTAAECSHWLALF